MIIMMIKKQNTNNSPTLLILCMHLNKPLMQYTLIIIRTLCGILEMTLYKLCCDLVPISADRIQLLLNTYATK